MGEKDYYAILHISKYATQEEIKRSYRRLALQYHPDTNGKKAGSDEIFKEINEAYSVLGDREKRHNYDMYGHMEKYGPGPFGNPYPYARGFGRGFRCMGKGMGMWRAFGRRGSGMGRGNRGPSAFAGDPFAKRAERAVYNISLTTTEARSGVEKEILLNIGGTTRKIRVKTPPGVKDKAMLFMKGEDLGQGIHDMYFQIIILK